MWNPKHPQSPSYAVTTDRVCVCSLHKFCGEKKSQSCCGGDYNDAGEKPWIKMQWGVLTSQLMFTIEMEPFASFCLSLCFIALRFLHATCNQTGLLSPDFGPCRGEFQLIKTEFSPNTWKKGRGKELCFPFSRQKNRRIVESWFSYDYIVVIGVIKFLAQMWEYCCIVKTRCNGVRCIDESPVCSTVWALRTVLELGARLWPGWPGWKVCFSLIRTFMYEPKHEYATGSLFIIYATVFLDKAILHNRRHAVSKAAIMFFELFSTVLGLHIMAIYAIAGDTVHKPQPNWGWSDGTSTVNRNCHAIMNVWAMF